MVPESSRGLWLETQRLKKNKYTKTNLLTQYSKKSPFPKAFGSNMRNFISALTCLRICEPPRCPVRLQQRSYGRKRSRCRCSRWPDTPCWDERPPAALGWCHRWLLQRWYSLISASEKKKYKIKDSASERQMRAQNHRDEQMLISSPVYDEVWRGTVDWGWTFLWGLDLWRTPEIWQMQREKKCLFPKMPLLKKTATWAKQLIPTSPELLDNPAPSRQKFFNISQPMAPQPTWKEQKKKVSLGRKPLK